MKTQIIDRLDHQSRNPAGSEGEGVWITVLLCLAMGLLFGLALTAI